MALGASGWLVLATALAATPAGLSELDASAHRLLEVKLERDGEVNVEAVRRRLGALAALAGSARPHYLGADVPSRLAAHATLAEAHEAFAKELFSAKAPRAARAESAARAWSEQVQLTVARALETAKAHARSCVALAQTAEANKDPAVLRCQAFLERAGEKGPAPTEPARVAKARMAELQACFDTAAVERPNLGALVVTATLELDGLGRVGAVTLTPRREDLQALYGCVRDGLSMWVFPGVSDAEIELPIRLAGTRR